MGSSLREQVVAEFAAREAELTAAREKALNDAERAEREAAEVLAKQQKALPSAGLAANVVTEAMIEDKEATVPFTGKNGVKRVATVRDDRPRAELNGSYADLQALLDGASAAAQEAYLRAFGRHIKERSGVNMHYETLVAIGFNKIRGLLMSVGAGKQPTRATWDACKTPFRRVMKLMRANKV